MPLVCVEDRAKVGDQSRDIPLENDVRSDFFRRSGQTTAESAATDRARLPDPIGFGVLLGGATAVPRARALVDVEHVSERRAARRRREPGAGRSATDDVVDAGVGADAIFQTLAGDPDGDSDALHAATTGRGSS